MSDSKILIRKATIKDLKDVLKLNRALFLKEYREFDKTLNTKWTYSKEGKKFFRDVILKKDNFCEVVEDKNKIIGYLNGGVKKIIPWHKKAKYAYLGSIFVKEKFRNRGLGSKLTKDFISWCKKNKFDYISVSSSVQNALGHKFYRKLKFKDRDLELQKKI
ncbi:MAG: GNAT family N-acetyltransferase [Candidatus Nealsonbacteria bacterium]